MNSKENKVPLDLRKCGIGKSIPLCDFEIELLIYSLLMVRSNFKLPLNFLEQIELLYAKLRASYADCVFNGDLTDKNPEPYYDLSPINSLKLQNGD